MLHNLKIRKKIFLIMPTVKLIKDKQEQADTGVFGFKEIIALYGGSEFCNYDIKSADIILLTPDRFVSLYEHNKNDWDDYINDTIVIDEEHTFEGSASFREAFSKLDNIIQFWKGHIFTITATRPYALSPTFSAFDEIQLSNNNVKTTNILTTIHEKSFWNLFTKYYNLGEEIILVTNDIRQILKVNGDINTITGPGLELKLKFLCVTDRKVYTSSKVTILSSSATEGIDINHKAHVMIITDFNHQHSAFSIQTIIQALGRPRPGLLESVVLVVNKKTRGELVKPHRNVSINTLVNTAQKTINDAKQLYHNPNQYYDCMLKAKHDHVCIILFDNEWVVDYQKACSQSAYLINANIFYSNNFIKHMNTYSKDNHIVFNGINIPKFSNVKGRKVAFQDSHKQFEKYSIKELHTFVFEATYSISDGTMSEKRDSGNITKSMLVALLIALVKKRLSLFKQDGLYNMFDNINRANQGISLLHSFCVYASQFEPYDISLKNVSNLSIGQTIALFDKSVECKTGIIIKEITVLHSTVSHFITQKDISTIQLLYYFMFSNKIRSQLIQNNMLKLKADGKTDDEIKVEKKKLTGSFVQMGAELLNALPDERKVIYSTRNYSALTTLNILDISTLYPGTVLEIDIISANPSFIDDIVKSSLATTVYNNIVIAENVDRNQAKVLYNTLLNCTPKQMSDIKKYKSLIKWGYTDDQAEQIVSETSIKGLMFMIMTEAEQIEVTKMLNAIQQQTHCLIARRHDSIIVFGKEKDVNSAEILFKQNITDITKYHFNRH